MALRLKTIAMTEGTFERLRRFKTETKSETFEQAIRKLLEERASLIERTKSRKALDKLLGIDKGSKLTPFTREDRAELWGEEE